MRAVAIAKAEHECRRFLAAMQNLRDRQAEDPHYGEYSKEAGSLKRASLDLTRALADLRRPGV